MFASALTPLILEDLEADKPFFIDSAALTLYPRARIIFIEGHPHSLKDVHALCHALAEACAAVTSHTRYPHSWHTTIGCVDVEADGFHIAINGTWHTPETVDCYIHALRHALEMCPTITSLK